MGGCSESVPLVEVYSVVGNMYTGVHGVRENGTDAHSNSGCGVHTVCNSVCRVKVIGAHSCMSMKFPFSTCHCSQHNRSPSTPRSKSCLSIPSQVTVLRVSRTRQNFTVDFSKLLHSFTKGQYLGGAHKRAVRVEREERNA